MKWVDYSKRKPEKEGVYFVKMYMADGVRVKAVLVWNGKTWCYRAMPGIDSELDENLVKFDAEWLDDEEVEE